MHVAAHIESADLTGNAEDALVGDEKCSTVAVQRRMGGHTAHRDAIVLAKEAGTIDLVLHSVGRESGELGSLLDVLGQRNDVGIGLRIVVYIESKLIHGGREQGLRRVRDVVRSAELDRTVKSREDVIEHGVPERFHSVVGQDSDGLPAIAADVNEGQTSFTFMFKQLSVYLISVRSY